MKYISTLVCLSIVASTSFASVKIASYNIRNFDSKKVKTDKVELKKIFTNLDADLISVEEIVNTSSFKDFTKKHLPAYKLHLSKCGGAGNQKLGFLYNTSKFTLLNVVENSSISSVANLSPKAKCASLRPAVIATFKENKTDEQFVAIALHLKAGANQRSFSRRWKQYKQVSNIVRSLNSKGFENILLMGDLNTTGYSILDADYNKFNEFLLDIDMNTIATELTCTSYWSGKNRRDNIEEASILDHIIYPNSFLGYKVKKVEVHSHCKTHKCSNVSSTQLGNSYANVSDHCPISITFK